MKNHLGAMCSVAAALVRKEFLFWFQGAPCTPGPSARTLRLGNRVREIKIEITMRLRSRTLAVLVLIFLEAALAPGRASANQGAGPTGAVQPKTAANPTPVAANSTAAATSNPAPANNTQAPPQTTPAKIVSVHPQDAPDSKQFALGNTIVVTLDDAALLKKGTPTNPMGLFLDGSFMNGIDALPVPNAPNALQFHLQYTAANQDAWSQLFGRKMRTFGVDEKVLITVGLKDGSSVAEDPYSLTLKFLPDGWAKLLLGLSMALAAATWMLGRHSSMLRDSGAPRTDGRLGTYSLGRTQMALWFVTIVFAFLFIYAVTGVAPPITQGALVLMGIGAGTALGASAIDQNNQTASSTSLVQLTGEQLSLQNQIQTLAQQIAAAPPGDPNLAALQGQQQTATQRLQAVNAQLAQTRALQVAASGGLIEDILTDINGVSFHRLQIVAWTLVLWVLFLSSLFGKLTMMDFDTTQLTLLGISGGTYLGFKLNEKQS